MVTTGIQLWAWRHPKPCNVAGRCIGQTDVKVDRRKVKRLAHRIRAAARCHGLPRVVHTSPLQRCWLVGRQLRQWGWIHIADPALIEASFGTWDGRLWSDISHAEVDAWVAQFLDHRPGGGESLRDVLTRVQAWQPQTHSQPQAMGVCVVTHGGWMLARQWVNQHTDLPTDAHQWPAPPSYGQCWSLR